MRGKIIRVERAGHHADNQFWGWQADRVDREGTFALVESVAHGGFYMLFIGDHPTEVNGKRKEDYLRTTPGQVSLNGRMLRLETPNTVYTIELEREPSLDVQLAEAKSTIAKLTGALEANKTQDPSLTALLP